MSDTMLSSFNCTDSFKAHNNHLRQGVLSKVRTLRCAQWGGRDKVALNSGCLLWEFRLSFIIHLLCPGLVQVPEMGGEQDAWGPCPQAIDIPFESVWCLDSVWRKRRESCWLLQLWGHSCDHQVTLSKSLLLWALVSTSQWVQDPISSDLRSCELKTSHFLNTTIRKESAIKFYKMFSHYLEISFYTFWKSSLRLIWTFFFFLNHTLYL